MKSGQFDGLASLAAWNALTCIGAGYRPVTCQQERLLRATTGWAPERARMTRNILIVKDNDLNMKLFHDLLEVHGYDRADQGRP